MSAYEMRISDWSSDVCSSDLHTVGRVFGQLGAVYIHHDYFFVITIERRVQFAHDVFSVMTIGTNNDAVGPHASSDSGDLFQEFGVRHTREGQLADRKSVV